MSLRDPLIAGLSRGQVRVLHALRELGPDGTDIGPLAGALAAAPTTVRTHLRRLRRLDLVVWRHGTAGRYAITARGRDAARWHD